jgi:hypothetical protein
MLLRILAAICTQETRHCFCENRQVWYSTWRQIDTIKVSAIRRTGAHSGFRGVRNSGLEAPGVGEESRGEGQTGESLNHLLCQMWRQSWSPGTRPGWPGWANWAIAYFGHFFSFTEVAQIFGLRFFRVKSLCINFDKKMCRATFWATLSQTHLVTLDLRSYEWCKIYVHMWAHLRCGKICFLTGHKFCNAAGFVPGYLHAWSFMLVGKLILGPILQLLNLQLQRKRFSRIECF